MRISAAMLVIVLLVSAGIQGCSDPVGPNRSSPARSSRKPALTAKVSPGRLVLQDSLKIKSAEFRSEIYLHLVQDRETGREFLFSESGDFYSQLMPVDTPVDTPE